MTTPAGVAGITGPSSLDDALERLSVFLLATGLAGLALALCGCFVAAIALAIGLLATLLYAARFPRSRADVAGVAGVETLRWHHVLPVLLVAFALRVPAFDDVLGGQDQGVYTNVAAHIVRTGGIAVHDPAYARLAGTPAREAYIAENHVTPFLPGVYTLPGDPPGFVFQFYHLFPVWMAVFGGLFGLGAIGGGLLLLSLVSVLFFQRLAHALTGRAGIAVAAGVLLAVNPLHAFFSKFPVTEVPTLAFSAMALSWLARYAQADAATRRVRWLVLSAGAFACLFLTRLSGFMYLPLLFAIAWLARPLDGDVARGRAVSRWALATIGLYALSVLYGLAWSRPYSIKVYELSFALAAGPHWPVVVAGAVGAALLLTALLARVPAGGEGAARLRDVVERVEGWFGPMLLLVLALGAWKLWRLGFTQAYAADAWLAQFPGIVGAGWPSLAHGSLVVVALYACPLALVAYVALAQRRWQPAGARLGLLFLLCFAGYAALLNWTVPYQPYFARYLASELVPYLLLFVACACAWVDGLRARRVLAATLLASGVYALALVLPTLGLRDGAGTSEALGRIAAIADDGDVLLIDAAPGQGFLPSEMKPTLAYTFGREVVTAGHAVLGDVSVLAALDAAYDDVFLVTSAPQPPPGFVRVDSVRLRTFGFPRTAAPPRQLAPVLDVAVQVYRMASVEFTPGRQLGVLAGDDARVQQQVGRRRAHVGVTADGRAGFLAYGPYAALPAGDYVLRVRGRAPVAGPVVDVTGHGGTLTLARLPTSPAGADGVVAAFPFHVPDPGLSDGEVRVLVPAGTPLWIRDYTITRLR